MTDPSPYGDSLLTVAEVAELLRLNQQTVRNWIDQDRLPAVRVGERRVRIKRSDVEHVIASGYTARPEDTTQEPPAIQGPAEHREQWERFGAAAGELSEAVATLEPPAIAAALESLAAAASALAKAISS